MNRINIEIGTQTVSVPESIQSIIYQMSNQQFRDGILESLANGHNFNSAEVQGILDMAKACDEHIEAIRVREFV
jgi:hypothetical protein